MPRLIYLIVLLASLISQPSVMATPPQVSTRVLMPLLSGRPAAAPAMLTSQWGAHLQWELANPSYTGSPFDVLGSATFTHATTGEQRTTGIFYIGAGRWAFRFSPTQPGVWSYRTSSADADLDQAAGRFTVGPATGHNGFVTSVGDNWIHSASGRAFIPQLVMAPAIDRLDDAAIDALIQTFIVEHGFSGFHLSMQCRWFDLSRSSCAEIDRPEPDLATFSRVERLISRTYAAGGVVHLWMWGDSDRDQNPTRWGLNGPEDLRLQRYLAARLGPLPGWTMGYGYDLWEWVSPADLATWQQHLESQLGWEHPLGARGAKNELSQLSETLDYAAYEQHKPSYGQYLLTISARPDKPAFSEDRFRVRDDGLSKDYTFAETRRGLWHSAMAGGVANIWGNLSGGRDSELGSLPYPNAAAIRTYATFFADRFTADLRPCPQLSDGACLARPDGQRYLIYREDAASITVDLGAAAGPLRAVAVDTLRPYAEIAIGDLDAGAQTWQAPYPSDWAIAIGEP